jgi:hypothetical protein
MSKPRTHRLAPHSILYAVRAPRWRPGETLKGASPSAADALERHADHAARLGVFAPERRDRRAA